LSHKDMINLNPQFSTN